MLGMPDLRGAVGSRTLTTVTLGVVFLFLTCAATCLRRRDWLPARLQQVRDLLVLPALGLAGVLVVALAAALVAGLGAIIAADDLRDTSSVAVLLAALPNIALSAFFVGGGAGAQLVTDSSDGDFEETWHLTTLADQASGWVWLMPLVTALALVAGAACVVLYSRSGHEARDGLLRWLAAMAMTSPLLAHFAAVHGHADGVGFGESYWADMTAGVSWWQSMLLTALWTFVAAVAATGLIPRVFGSASLQPWAHGTSPASGPAADPNGDPATQPGSPAPHGSFPSMPPGQ